MQGFDGIYKVEESCGMEPTQMGYIYRKTSEGGLVACQSGSGTVAKAA